MKKQKNVGVEIFFQKITSPILSILLVWQAKFLQLLAKIPPK